MEFTPEMVIWKPIGAGTQIFDEIKQGSNLIVVKRMKYQSAARILKENKFEYFVANACRTAISD